MPDIRGSSRALRVRMVRGLSACGGRRVFYTCLWVREAHDLKLPDALVSYDTLRNNAEAEQSGVALARVEERAMSHEA